MNPVNARNTPGRACYECGSTNHVRPACLRLNMAQNREETIQIKLLLITRVRVVETKRTNFVSTSFIPLLGIEPSELGFRYEIEIASGQLVEIDKVIKGCRLEIKGHVFDIDLIPFGHGSFDVLRVVGERPEEKERLLMSVKNSDKYQEEILVVRDFLEDKSRNSKTKVSFDQVHRLGERRIDDLFDQLQGSQFFSKIDLRSRYCRDQLRPFVDPNLIDLSSLLKLSHLG
nr:hypothetical protein [Tanacetum cinerariifolium]